MTHVNATAPSTAPPPPYHTRSSPQIPATARMSPPTFSFSSAMNALTQVGLMAMSTPFFGDFFVNRMIMSEVNKTIDAYCNTPEKGKEKKDNSFLSSPKKKKTPEELTNEYKQNVMLYTVMSDPEIRPNIETMVLKKLGVNNNDDNNSNTDFSDFREYSDTFVDAMIDSEKNLLLQRNKEIEDKLKQESNPFSTWQIMQIKASSHVANNTSSQNSIHTITKRFLSNEKRHKQLEKKVGDFIDKALTGEITFQDNFLKDDKNKHNTLTLTKDLAYLAALNSKNAVNYVNDFLDIDTEKEGTKGIAHTLKTVSDKLFFTKKGENIDSLINKGIESQKESTQKKVQERIEIYVKQKQKDLNKRLEICKERMGEADDETKEKLTQEITHITQELEAFKEYFTTVNPLFEKRKGLLHDLGVEKDEAKRKDIQEEINKLNQEIGNANRASPDPFLHKAQNILDGHASQFGDTLAKTAKEQGKLLAKQFFPTFINGINKDINEYKLYEPFDKAPVAMKKKKELKKKILARIGIQEKDLTGEKLDKLKARGILNKDGELNVTLLQTLPRLLTLMQYHVEEKHDEIDQILKEHKGQKEQITAELPDKVKKKFSNRKQLPDIDEMSDIMLKSTFKNKNKDRNVKKGPVNYIPLNSIKGMLKNTDDLAKKIIDTLSNKTDDTSKYFKYKLKTALLDENYEGARKKLMSDCWNKAISKPLDNDTEKTEHVDSVIRYVTRDGDLLDKATKHLYAPKKTEKEYKKPQRQDGGLGLGAIREERRKELAGIAMNNMLIDDNFMPVLIDFIVACLYDPNFKPKNEMEKTFLRVIKKVLENEDARKTISKMLADDISKKVKTDIASDSAASFSEKTIMPFIQEHIDKILAKS